MNIKTLSPLAILSFCSIILLNACTSSPSFKQEDLHGTWKSVEAYRSAKKTESLANTYFTFGSDGTMETNLTMTSDTIKGKYTFIDSAIKETGINDLTYDVETLNPENLTITFKLKEMDFKILLDKVDTK